MKDLPFIVILSNISPKSCRFEAFYWHFQEKRAAFGFAELIHSCVRRDAGENTLDNSAGMVYNRGGDGEVMINVSPNQFGKKIGKHAQDYGLDPKNVADREKMSSIISDIVCNYDEIRRGTWPGQDGEVDFYIKGDDVVISNNGEFVSILKDGITNMKVIRARGLSKND